MIDVIVGIAVLLSGALWLEETRPWERNQTVSSILHLARAPIASPDMPSLDEDAYRTYQRTQVALLQRPELYSDLGTRNDFGNIPAARKPATRDEWSRWLADHLRVEIIEGTELVRVSLGGGPPASLKAILDRLVDSYVEYHKNNEYQVIRNLMERQELRQHGLLDQLRSRSESIASLEGAKMDEPGKSPALAVERVQFEIARREYLRVSAAVEELKLASRGMNPHVRVISRARVNP